MTKNFKLALALILSIMMILSSVSALAADDDPAPATSTGHTITVPSTDTHKYAVYQILTGELSDGKDTLSNVTWGSSVNAQTDGKINGKTATEFAKSLEGLSGVDAVAEVAKYFTAATADTVSTDTKKVAIIDKDTPATGLATGYYVMVDVTAAADMTVSEGNYFKEDTRALNVIQLVDDVTVAKKWGTTENDKGISADTLGKDGDEKNTYDPLAKDDNVSIGDVVSYTLTAKVPENADQFKEGTFFFVITDKLSTGLTFNDDIAVSAGTTTPGTTTLNVDTNYTVQKGINGNTFEIGLINAASYKGQTITVTYTATLNENAVIGDAGNPNTSTVKFSNNPNKTYDGSPEDENHKGFPDSTKDVPTGETPEKTTITYSTAIEILKVDENGEPMKDSIKFELTGQSAKKVVTKTTAFTVDNTNGTYYKLKDGTYTMVAPTDENTMIDAEPGASKGYVEDDEATGDGVITIGTKKYRAYVPDTDADKKIYILKEGSADAYADSNKYSKTVTQKTVDSNVTDHKMEEAPDDNGIVRFDGLGAGSYTLKETQWPDGYNKAEDVSFTVEYDADGTAKFKVTNNSTVKYEDGVFKVKIMNKKGAKLPETGGIGTTIFYVAGSIMVLAAAILLITKRRMGAND